MQLPKKMARNPHQRSIRHNHPVKNKSRFGLDKGVYEVYTMPKYPPKLSKKSPNHDVRFLHQATAETNIQNDTHNDSMEVTKAVRSQQITRISDELEYQGYIVKLL